MGFESRKKDGLLRYSKLRFQFLIKRYSYLMFDTSQIRLSSIEITWKIKLNHLLYRIKVEIFMKGQTS